MGISAVQLALGHGCTVLGTAGTQDGMDLVKSQGTHAVFNHREPGYVDKIQVGDRTFCNKNKIKSKLKISCFFLNITFPK